jgi:predicted enzyme related to lactoylglutathione lyase
MPSTLIAIAVDCADPDRLARFWGAVFGTDVIRRWTDADGTEYTEVGTEPILLLQPVPEEKTVKNRLHLDVAAPGDQHEEVRRLVDLGATVLSDEPRHPWVLLADPEGNEFCVLPPRTA